METQSNRKQAFAQPQSNPSKKFLKWKSNDKCFEYWDKEEKKNVTVSLPFKFLVLDEMHTISGWNDATSSGIYSNEVKYISKEIMTVKPFKGNEIAKGLYKEIKERVQAAGGYYVKSIYIMLSDGTLANIQLKGSAVQAWGEFTQKSRARLSDEWVEVSSAREGKKGAVKFYVPEFKYSKSLTAKESEDADLVFNVLEAYLKAYLVKDAAPVEVEEVEDDLDF